MPARRATTTSSRRAAEPRRSANPATLVLLVRHGETPTTGKVLPGRAAGLHLSERGRAQAEAVAARIAALGPVDALYSSPLERTRETAAPIAKACGLRVRTDKDLLECDFGGWTGASLARLARRREWRAVQLRPSGFTFPGGESIAGMQLRMTAALRRLAAAHRGGVVVAVSHADPIKALLCDALGAHLDSYQRLVVSPCSISALAVGDATTTVLAVNNTGDDLAGVTGRPS